MINLYGEEISQDTSSATVGIDHSAGEKGSAVPESSPENTEANFPETFHSSGGFVVFAVSESRRFAEGV